jgi:hypothetical protein
MGWPAGSHHELAAVNIIVMMNLLPTTGWPLGCTHWHFSRMHYAHSLAKTIQPHVNKTNPPYGVCTPKGKLRCSGIIRSVWWLFLTDVSEQSIGHFFKGRR